MAKPRQLHNGPDIPKGPGDRAAETGGEGEETGKGWEGGEGKESTTNGTPQPPAEEQADTGKAVRQERERRRRHRRKKRRKREETGTERTHGGTGRGHTRGGGCHPYRGKRGPPGIPPRTCTPVVAGSLWRLPESQKRVAPGQGNSGRRCMPASLPPPCCSVRELVRHALRIYWAPIYGYLGRGMEGEVSHGVGTPRDPSSLPTSFSRRRWASATQERSGPGSRGAWTSGRGASRRVW